MYAALYIPPPILKKKMKISYMNQPVMAVRVYNNYSTFPVGVGLKGL
jgi:hypothetical protein